MNFDFSQFKIVGGAMSWVSNPKLVSAISNAGGLGLLAAGGMSSTMLDTAIAETKKLTSNIFGVNLIAMHPEFKQMIEICASHGVKIVVLGAAMPRKETIDFVKERGMKVVSFASSLLIANSMIKNGIDALILEGHEAGGHVGPISTQVLVQEILFNIKDFPVFVAGGIGCGKMIAHYIKLGAVGCQLGTKFVCATESPVHSNVKKCYIAKQARDTVVVSSIDPIFSVIPVRVIRNAAVAAFYQKQKEVFAEFSAGKVSSQEAQLNIERFWSGSLKKGVIEGDLENGSLMAGQSISFVQTEETAAEIIKKLLAEIGDYL